MVMVNLLVKRFLIEASMKYSLFIILLSISSSVLASDIIPTGNANNALYYKIGGGADYALPPVEDTQTMNLGANADLSMGNTCGAFNPALSISDTLNSLKDDAENVEQAVLTNATGSLTQMPLYWLAQANPTAYNQINNWLLKADERIKVSTRSCQEVKDQIAKGQNPYKDWGTLAVGDQWKQHLSLTANGQEDINTAKKDVDEHAGDSGVAWVQGNKSSDGSYHAGGLNQPPVHVISDTVKAGYNALLMRDLNSTSPAPQGGELAAQFPTPNDAATWITNVVGDQTITTCNDSSCKANQGGISGRGLLPWITACGDQNKAYCTNNIRDNLANLITGQTPMTKDNLEAVSASGLVISPQVINAIRNMDSTQQGIITNKLAQEVAIQRVMDRALIARNILQTGSQVPVIAANQPAQHVVDNAIQHLDKDIQSLAFESQIRKQMMSDTVSSILNYQSSQQAAAMDVGKVNPAQPLMENSAITAQGAHK